MDYLVSIGSTKEQKSLRSVSEDPSLYQVPGVSYSVCLLSIGYIVNLYETL